ncbi:MAG TPA: SDR family oxidoreductase [Ktedonobacteraceae bacterium]|nr:SDR family oxidoreductase [Ktedonobacteraceae bacterium]
MDLYTEKTALITGASTGIGAAFATRLAAAGTHLILVARSEEKLRALASQLADQHAIRAEVIVADLSRVGAARTVFEETQKRGLAVDILINNAGFGTYGQFDTIDAQREQQEILLNVAALVDLTHRFLPVMVARRQGAIINVASLAAFQPTPYMAVYGATKAFVLSFSEALWGEYRTKGIRVLALCPGETATEFFQVVGNGYDTPLGNAETPEKVVQVALRALEQGRPSVISGRQNALSANLSRFFPRGQVVRLVAQLTKQRLQAKAV